MKFFEFNDSPFSQYTKFPYYALIGADDVETAMYFYNESVADIDVEQIINNEEPGPEEITLESARELFLKANAEDIPQPYDPSAEFEKLILSDEPVLLCVDGSLS